MTPGPHRFGRLGDWACVASQAALVDQSLDAGAREGAERVGQEAVNPLAGVRRAVR